MLFLSISDLILKHKIGDTFALSRIFPFRPGEESICLPKQRSDHSVYRNQIRVV